MTERERLIELIQNAVDGCARHWAEVIADHLLANGVIVLDTSSVDVVTNREPIRTAFGMPLDELSDLIRAKQQGNLIVPPCKVGDACYPLPRYKTPLVERKISRITYSKRNIIIGYYENDGQYRPPLRTRILGEDVFLAREEAEKALAERSKG